MHTDKYVVGKGIEWTAAMLLERFLWVGVSLLILPAASVLFNRFDPSRERVFITRPKKMQPSE